MRGVGTGVIDQPPQAPGDLSQPRFPRDQGLKATIRPLDDYSNTYLGLTVVDSTVGTGHYKYGEYQYVCSTAQILAKTCFDKIDEYQLFDLTSDPYELRNIYNETAPGIREELAKRLRKWYPCQGSACP